MNGILVRMLVVAGAWTLLSGTGRAQTPTVMKELLGAAQAAPEDMPRAPEIAGKTAAAPEYRAVLEDGEYACRNARGQKGLNKVPVDEVKRSKVGECTKLSHEYFAGLAVIRTDLREANFKGANLYGAMLLRADLVRADLSGADMSRADLRGAAFIGARLHLADLSMTWMAGADLRKADMRGAYLEGARMWNAKLNGADLRGANLGDEGGAYLWEGADLSGAVYDAGTKLPFDEAQAKKRGMVKAGG